MYRATVKHNGRIMAVEIYETLEDAIYEGTHAGYGLLRELPEKTQDAVFAKRPEALILNDEFIFKWRCGVETAVTKYSPKSATGSGSKLLYGGDTLFQRPENKD